MHIYIKGISEPFKRAVDVLVQLFYEEAALIYDDEAAAEEAGMNETTGLSALDMQGTENKVVSELFSTDIQKQIKEQLKEEAEVMLIFCSLQEIELDEKDSAGAGVSAEIHLHSLTTGQALSSQYVHSFVPEPQEDHKEQRRPYKYALNRALLDILEKYTEIKQPWGILTGIRPTKLLHQKLISGATQQAAQEELIRTYRIAPEKAQLMQKIVDVQMKAIPDLHQLQKEVSIYIGIPFCPTKCAYCTFPAYDIKGQQGSVGAFLEGLHFEIEELGQWLKESGIGITTIYFGGGTPTSIEAEQMDALYEQMYRCFPKMDRVREVTVEAGRPDTITPEKIRVLQKHNIDRISINPQSYTQETLEAIGRHHTVEETIQKYELARSMGLSNINMDLIIGLPGEGLAQLQHSLEKTEQLKPESLTVHTLSFKRASTMTKNRSKYKVASREEIIQMMELAADWTERQGYLPYYLYRQKNILGNLENVGYALPDKESLYNIIIMEEKQTIIGLGCGASSKLVHPITGKIERFANPKEPRAYNQGYRQYSEDKLKLLRQLYQGVAPERVQ